MKICIKCKIFKSKEFYHKDKTQKDGCRNKCKDCVKIYNDEYNLINVTTISSKMKKYYKNNDNILKFKRKEYVKNNKDKVQLCDKNYYNKNIKTYKEKIKVYYEKNKIKRKQKNKEWQQNNLFKCKMYNYKRRFNKLQRTPKWLSEKQFEEIDNIYKLSNKMKKETGIKYEVDHIIPINSNLVCGLHVPWNLQILTKEENNKKKNKLLEKYL